ncbi:MAG: lipid A phosphoethanolamine transferase [Alistipes sp.]|nr:lipid A phosphoethanolamine transferase [Alistipes sp.]
MGISHKFSATKLAVGFVAALMLPIIILTFTERYPILITVSSILLPLGAYMMFAALSKRSGRMVWWGGVFIFLSAFQIVLSYLFGNSVIAADMFLNLITTNSGEASELLRNIYPAIIVVCIIYIPLLWVATVHLINRVVMPSSLRRNISVAGLASFLLGLWMLNIGTLEDKFSVALRDDIFPINACYNLALSISEAHKINNYTKSSEGFVYNATRSDSATMREIYVLVIGEASRAANWQLYGYKRKTTPLLAKRDDVILFRGVTTQSNTTHKSVPMLLSSVSPTEHNMLYYRKGLPTLFNEAGFETYFISNQSPQGAMIDHLAADADHTIYIDGEQYDSKMVELMNRIIKTSPSQKMLFILHSYGSHFSYRKRYPREYAKFLPDDDISISQENMEHIRNAYDNSILYTDYFLSEVIRSLRAYDNACSAMLYCSDHGEDLMDDRRNRFLHSSPTTSYYQLHIAALAWFSPYYDRYFSDKVSAARYNASNAATTHSVFHTMADIASIQSPYFRPSVSLVSREFDPTISRRYINDHNRAVPLDRRIGIDASQRSLFRRAGVAMP